MSSVSLASDGSGSADRRLAITEGSIALRKGQVGSDLNAYQWTFEKLVDVRSMIFVGDRSANASNDNFSIQFSTQHGRKWTTVFTVTNTAEDRLTDALSSPLNGMVLVRAIDTDSSNKDRELDTLYVDQLAFSTASTASGSVHKAFAEVPIIGSASGHGSCCEASTGGFDDHHDEGDHEESGMHVLPLEVETSPPAESLAGGGEHASSLPESDPLALWCAAAATLA